MALEHQVDQLAARASSAAEKRRQAIARLVGRRDRIVAFRACFLDEEGHVSRAGQRVLAELGAFAKVGVIDDASMSEAELRTRAGARAVVLMIFDNLDLDETKLTRLGQQLRRTAHE